MLEETDPVPVWLYEDPVLETVPEGLYVEEEEEPVPVGTYDEPVELTTPPPVDVLVTTEEVFV